MRPSMPTRNLARRRLVRREPADWRPAMKTRSGRGRSRRRRRGRSRRRARARAGAGQAVQLGGRAGQQVGLVGRADLGGGGDDQAARAAAGVLAQLGELDDVAELGRRAQLALADRPGVGIGHGDQPVGDLLARQPLTDLARDLAGALGQLLQTPAAASLRRAPRPRARARRCAASRRASRTDRSSQRAGLAGQPQRGRLALAGARRHRPVELAAGGARSPASGPAPAARPGPASSPPGGLARRAICVASAASPMSVG